MSICRCQKHDISWDSDSKEACPVCAPEVDALYNKIDEIDKFLEYMSVLSNLGFKTKSENFPFVFEMLSDNKRILNEEIQKMNEIMFF